MQINRSLKILFLCNSIFVFSSHLFGPLYAVFVEKIGGGVIAISTSWSVFMLSATLTMFLVSKFGDRVKEKEYLLAGGFLLRALAWLGYLAVGNFTGLIVIQIILGIGEAIGTPAWSALFAKHLDNKHEVSDYSNWNILANAVSSVSTLLGGFIVTFFGFNSLFLIMAGLALFSFILVLITPRRVL